MEKKIAENQNHFKSYGVFCVAMFINIQNPEKWVDCIDVLWDEAVKYYQEFTLSEFNVETRSELECINEYMQDHYNKFPKIEELLDGSTSDLNVDLGSYLEEELGLSHDEVVKKIGHFWDENNIPISIDLGAVEDVLTSEGSSLREFEAFLK